mgnify:CR=1 FL=1
MEQQEKLKISSDFIFIKFLFVGILGILFLLLTDYKRTETNVVVEYIFIFILLFSRSFCRFFTRHELHIMSVNSSFQLLFSLTTTHHHATRKHSHSRCIDDDTLFY